MYNKALLLHLHKVGGRGEVKKYLTWKYNVKISFGTKVVFIAMQTSIFIHESKQSLE